MPLTVNNNYFGDMLIHVFLKFFRYSIPKRIFVVWASWMWEKQLYVCCAFELYHIYKTIPCLLSVQCKNACSHNFMDST